MSHISFKYISNKNYELVKKIRLKSHIHRNACKNKIQISSSLIRNYHFF